MSSINVKILGDATSLERAFRRAKAAGAGFNKSVGTSARSSRQTSSAMGGLRTTVLGLGGAYLGAAGLIGAVRGSWQEMEQASAVTAQTNAVLKSTGGVANVTAAQVGKLADSLLRKTGVDDETIKSGANMLLTFRAIRNETGKGNDIFNQATKTILDMDTALTRGNVTQESLTKSSIRVGKALQDPIRGITALRRVGVAFTEQQTSQIKAMVKSGNVIGAQKLILAELNTEFGGSAAAFGGTLPGKINLLRETVRNLGGAMLTTLMPAITQTVNRLTAWFSKTKNQQAVMNGFRSVVAGVSTVVSALRTAFGLLSGIVGSNTAAIKLLVGAFVAYKALGMVASIGRLTGAFGGLHAAALLAGFAIGTLAVKKIPGLESALENVGGKAFDATNRIANMFGGGVDSDAQLAAAQKRVAATVAARKKLIAETPSGLLAQDKIEGNRPQVAAAARASADVAKKATTTVKKALGKSATELAQQRNNWFDALIGRKIDRVQDISGETGQIAALGKIAAQIRARIAATKDITRRYALEDQLLDVVRQQRGLRAQKAENDKTARDEAIARKKELAEAAAAARIAKQFRALGLTGTGETRTPGKTNLRKQLGSLSENVKGTILDTGKTRSMLARIRKVLSEGIVPDDVRAKIAEMLAGVRDELKEGVSKNHTLFKKQNADAVLAGIGLSPEQFKLAKGRIAQIGAGGTVPGARTAAFSGAGGRPTVVHTTVNLDGQRVAKNTTTHQQKAGKRRVPSRRGPAAGLSF